MECIFGARKYQSGTILLNGKEVRFTTPIQAIKAGIGLVPEDRKKQGLVLGNTVGFNLTLASIDSYINGIAISDRKCQEVIDYYKEKLHIKAVAGPGGTGGSGKSFRRKPARRLSLENGWQSSRMS